MKTAAVVLISFAAHFSACWYGSAFILDTTPTTANLHVERMKADVRNHSAVASNILQMFLHGSARNETYEKVADLVDKFGNRPAGSPILESAIDYIVEKLKNESFDNVHTENVTVPHWVRGEEYAMILKPRLKHLDILGLGSSIATPSSGIQAEAIVVHSYDELERRASEARGKIVVFNQDWVNYGVSGRYRFFGAAHASAVGAVATLIRSVTPFSINTPHTGWQDYNDSIAKIPTACITVEDAEMLARMASRGEAIEIILKMSPQTLPDKVSRNIVADITGSEYPEQVVVMAGHIDSWDVGQGAMDDAAGSFLGWQALSVIQRLGLQPRRTIRAIMYTAEEEGYYGAHAYFKAHQNETDDFNFVMESDEGAFTPKGLFFGGNKDAAEVMQEILNFLKPINASNLRVSPNFDGGDNQDWVEHGVPGANLDTHNEKYFYFHHTEGDTMTVYTPKELDLSAALWTVVAYTLADIEDMLPRDAQT